MAPNKTYSLADVLSVAKLHPFYCDAKYPPDNETILTAREKAASGVGENDLTFQPLLRKKDLYTVIERLVNDTSPENTYRHNVYTSVTGGGSTLSRPLFFATDALENRRQRAHWGDFLKKTGIIQCGDWVLTTHCGGGLYRSLDLTLETFENAGASVLAAGNYSTPSETVNLLQEFSVNVLTGDGSQVVSVVHHISTLTEGREKIKLDKIIYTSESLTAVQRAHIHSVLGSVKICSIIGSAEAGPYGVSSPDLIPSTGDASHNDFVIDTRISLFEILPPKYADNSDGAIPETLPDGDTGIIAQTVLTRLRNPVIRYITGDVGSLHPLPEQARSVIPAADWPYLRILRLQGRDRRFSFSWDGDDYQFANLETILLDEKFGVLQWQIILDKMKPSLEVLLEIRLLCSEDAVSRKTVLDRVKQFFLIYPPNEHKFLVNFVSDISGFELSKTGRKVIKFVDRSA